MTKTNHPAPFSAEIIDVLRTLIPRDQPVHDPFAGDGRRLAALCADLGVRFTGTELEAPFIRDDRVRPGNSLDASTYPRRPGFTIVTSPVYPNGVADHHHAQERCKRCEGTGRMKVHRIDAVVQEYETCDKCGGSGRRNHHRRTYRQARASIVGRDEPLHQDNMGRWGYRGRGAMSDARIMYWSLANRIVARWHRAGLVLVNVSDFLHSNGRRETVVDQWGYVLSVNGWNVTKSIDVATRRYKDGANRDARVEAEVILVARRVSS